MDTPRSDGEVPAEVRRQQILSLVKGREFVREMHCVLTSDRPQIVFDLSQVRRLDAAGVDMLLHCMAEVMKRDGDLKLGQRVEIYCTTLDMSTAVYDRYYVARGDRIVDVWPIMGRGGAAQR